MFYSFNFGAGNYDFIYDDTDKSVELVDVQVTLSKSISKSASSVICKKGQTPSTATTFES